MFKASVNHFNLTPAGQPDPVSAWGSLHDKEGDRIASFRGTDDILFDGHASKTRFERHARRQQQDPKGHLLTLIRQDLDALNKPPRRRPGGRVPVSSLAARDLIASHLAQPGPFGPLELCTDHGHPLRLSRNQAGTVRIHVERKVSLQRVLRETLNLIEEQGLPLISDVDHRANELVGRGVLRPCVSDTVTLDSTSVPLVWGECRCLAVHIKTVYPFWDEAQRLYPHFVTT
ncbi:hypothetical protein [Deinococcus soli (ex Cha et al. 2016)]|uniref:Uncharacterized protein n=2 Tax=Deinococcus soli (ex Cha et al. 2016) TaxID=1309411 RepID=A0ACC6KFH7_9DEIO|nr:hypothetical protein [Deinococcus soli (ex Cha et al. 2016)]MDR6218310.1 hypothetical protein [Deinococcus soli (ex Cha et al. 2016)]MDR6329050.1 hypothetical protein [Deinococcus soli (ex Cha et al. 2016)]MDR6751323.1 hypothetical protein [Deinococcus soli (ex Cha et al. 2016)]